jgi:hypothetical protein
VTVANIVPFPLARRRAFVERHARLMAAMRPDAGERHLERQLAFQFETLRRKNIDVRAIDREVASLRSAIHAAIAHGMFKSGDFA